MTSAPVPSFDATRLTRLRNRKAGYLTDTLTNSRFTKPVTAATWAGGVAHLTSAGHGYSVGTSVLVAGITPNGYNGPVTLTAVTTDTVSYALSVNPGAATTFGTVSVLIPCRVALVARDLHFGEVGRFVESRRWRIVQPYGTTVDTGDILTDPTRGTYIAVEVLSDATLAASATVFAVQQRTANGTLNIVTNAVVSVTRSRRNPPRPTIDIPALPCFIRDRSANLDNPDSEALLFRWVMTFDADTRYPDDPNSKIGQGDTVHMAWQGRTRHMTISNIRYNLYPIPYAIADLGEAK